MYRKIISHTLLPQH